MKERMFENTGWRPNPARIGAPSHQFLELFDYLHVEFKGLSKIYSCQS
jgi:hypothetical protein